MSSSRWTPMTRSSCSTTLLKFWNKTPLTKLGNPSLRLRKGPWRFGSWSIGLDWLKVASGCPRKMTGQGIVRILACFEEFRREKKRSISPDFSNLFLQVIIRDSCIATCIVGHRIWRSGWHAYSSGESASYLNCHLFNIKYFFYPTITQVECSTRISKFTYLDK